MPKITQFMQNIRQKFVSKINPSPVLNFDPYEFLIDEKLI